MHAVLIFIFLNTLTGFDVKCLWDFTPTTERVFTLRTEQAVLLHDLKLPRTRLKKKKKKKNPGSQKYISGHVLAHAEHINVKAVTG